MSRSKTPYLAWSLWALGITFVFGTFALGILNGNHHLSGLAFIAVELAFSTVGALLASRRPGNAIGWLFCACGVLLALAAFAEAYATHALITAPGSLPGGVAAATLSSWLEGPIGFGVLLGLIALQSRRTQRFPPRTPVL